MRAQVRRRRIGAGAFVLAIGVAGGAGAQVPSTAPARMNSQAVGGGLGSPTINPYANPFANPAMNPFLNPVLTQQQMNRSDMLLYFMAAQQTRKVATAGAIPRPTAGRVAPARPVPNGPIPGRFDDVPSFSDAGGRLSSRFPAFGRVAVDAATGSPVVPGASPAANAGTDRYFNRNPARNGYRPH